MQDPGNIYPVRAAVAWVREEEGLVVLLPKPLGPVSRAFRRLTRGPSHLRVPLDEVGARAFLLADGTRTADRLAADLEEACGDRAGPRDRALAFVATLAHNGLVRLATAPTQPPDPPSAMVREVACGHCGRRFHVAEPPGTRLRCARCGRKVAEVAGR